MNYAKIEANLCKGCRMCVQTCPKHCIYIGNSINEIGYQYAVFKTGAACTACGLCFYVCPEPGAITVFKDLPEAPEDEEIGRSTQTSGSRSSKTGDGSISSIKKSSSPRTSSSPSTSSSVEGSRKGETKL